MTREKARQIVNTKIIELTDGFPTIDDLSDSMTLCNALDDMEGMDELQANYFAIEIAEEMLTEEGLPI